MAVFGFDIEYTVESQYKAKIMINAPSAEEAYADVETFTSQLPVPYENKHISRFLVYSQIHSPPKTYNITQIEKATDG